MTSVCFLCGLPGADTTEHVVPRCLYPGKLPSDVVTLPAHRACNVSTSKDEEAFRNHIAVSIPEDHPAHALWEDTWRAIHREQGRGMMTTYYKDMLSREEVQPDGSVVKVPVAARIPEVRADRVLAKIVRGLHYKLTGNLLPQHAFWKVNQRIVPHVQRAGGPILKIHDVAEFEISQPGPGHFWHFLSFYDLHSFAIQTLDPSCLRLGPPRGPRPLSTFERLRVFSWRRDND